MLKRLKNKYRKEFFRPIAHMVFTRAILGLAAALLWNEFVNIESALSMRTFAFLFLGVFLLVMAWMAYLRLDGVKAPVLDKHLFEWKKKPKRIRGDLIDFVDEDVVSFDDLERDEKDFCRLVANILCGAAFLILSSL